MQRGLQADSAGQYRSKHACVLDREKSSEGVGKQPGLRDLRMFIIEPRLCRFACKRPIVNPVDELFDGDRHGCAQQSLADAQTTVCNSASALMDVHLSSCNSTQASQDVSQIAQNSQPLQNTDLRVHSMCSRLPSALGQIQTLRCVWACATVIIRG
jgi:hypothetical protein